MNLYKLENSALSKFHRMEHLVLILCFLFAKPTFENYRFLTKLSQTSILNFNMGTVCYCKCKEKSNYTVKVRYCLVV